MSQDDVFVRVLLIEDNVGDATLLKLAFADIDASIIVNWIPTAEAALRHIDEPNPAVDLILLDLNLPRMSGPDFLRALKERPLASKFPVMILSNSAPVLDIKDVYQDERVSRIVKPSDLNGYREIAWQILGWYKDFGSKPSQDLDCP